MACIVGRVLAAGKGTAECMGWISSPITPRGVGEGWVNIEAEPVDVEKSKGKPRIWHKSAIERDGNVIGGADSSSVLPGDFILPPDDVSLVPMATNLE